MADSIRVIYRDEVRGLLQVEEEFLLSLEREEIIYADVEGGFSPPMFDRIRVCRDLHHDLGVNLAGLEIALRLLETIRAERSQFREVLEWLGREWVAKRD